jgi:hypothetical protein
MYHYRTVYGLPDRKNVGYVLRGRAVIPAIGEKRGQPRPIISGRAAVRVALLKPKLIGFCNAFRKPTVAAAKGLA